MSTPTALLRAKQTIAAGVVAAAMASMVHPAAAAAAAAPQPTHHRTVTVEHIELTASVTTDGSTQRVGVADAYLYALDQTQLVSQLDAIRSLGVTDLRIVVPWIYIQPTSSSTYSWSQMDNVINTAHAMGFTLTASITGNPTWDGTPLIGAPNPAAYAAFAAAVAQRYTDQVSAYEVWNEPNAVTFMAPSDPAAYTAVLKAAYSAIKAVQPSATVIAGVLGAVTTVPGMSLAPEQFLAQMYAAGAQGFFDAVSFHPYNYTLPFSAGAGVANSPLEQVQAMYALMAANGDALKQIWATEYGNATQPGGITQTQQSQMLADFVTAWSKLPFAGPAFVYTANDLNTGFLLDENNLGLFTTGGLPKLAARTLATLISQLASGTLPNYTAPVMPAAQTIWIQAVSLAMSVANEVLLIPNMATQAIYHTLPAPLKQAFSAVANAVSLAAGTTLTAVTPLAERAIDTLITAGPNVAHAAAAINHAVVNAGAAINSGVQHTMLAVGTAAHNTELTVAAAVQQLTAAAAFHPTAATPTATGSAASTTTASKQTAATATPNASTTATPTTTSDSATVAALPSATTATAAHQHPAAAVTSPSASVATPPAGSSTTRSAAAASTATRTDHATAPATAHATDIAAAKSAKAKGATRGAAAAKSVTAQGSSSKPQASSDTAHKAGVPGASSGHGSK